MVVIMKILLTIIMYNTKKDMDTLESKCSHVLLLLILKTVGLELHQIGLREPQCGEKKSFCLLKNVEILELALNHHYHQQVQGQCGVSGLRWNDFVLMTDLTFSDQGVHVQRIHFAFRCFSLSYMKLWYYNRFLQLPRSMVKIDRISKFTLVYLLHPELAFIH